MNPRFRVNVHYADRRLNDSHGYVIVSADTTIKVGGRRELGVSAEESFRNVMDVGDAVRRGMESCIALLVTKSGGLA